MVETIIAKEFPGIKSLNGISEKTATEHYKLYEGYVKKANEIMTKLENVDRSSGNPTYSDLRELKTELSFAFGGIRNHEIYFEHLGGGTSQPEELLAEQIVKDFGSYENWERDIKATAMSARGWAWLVFDHKLNRLINHLGDSQNTYLLWFATPLIALDTYEHAYWLDFGTDRSRYIDAFFGNLNWKVIEKSFAQLKSAH